MPLHTVRSAAPLLVLLASVQACTSFAAVRSAEVLAGPSLTLQGSVSTPPGDASGWFWALDCAVDCNHPIVAADAGIAFGSTAGTPFTLGAGLSGMFPYAEGYFQLRTGDRPYGVGARVGIPVTTWSEHQLYARYDRPLGPGRRLLLNPTLFFHTGNSPNGANPGHFLAFVQGVGLMMEGTSADVVPALSLAVGRGERERSEEDDVFYSAFATLSVSVTFHRARPSTPRPDLPRPD